MFGVVPKTMWSKAYSQPDESNRIPMSARCLLLQSADRKILVDTGNSAFMSEKLKSIYKIDFDSDTLIGSLASIGISPSEITDVVLTHLHFDHTGGSTKLVDGVWIPAFPKAKYVVQREHWEWAVNPREKDRASFQPEFFVPLKEHAVLNFSEGDGEILPGIFARRMYGHTSALQIIEIFDGIESLLFPADLFPTHAHIPVPYVMGYDNCPMTSIEEKKRLLPELVEKQTIVVFEHSAFVPAGRVIHTGKGFSLGESVSFDSV